MFQSNENEQTTTPCSWLHEFHKYSVEWEKLSKINYKFVWLYDVQTQTMSVLSYNSRWLLTLERKLVTRHRRTSKDLVVSSFLSERLLYRCAHFMKVELSTFNVCIFSIYTSVKFYVTKNPKWKIKSHEFI